MLSERYTKHLKKTQNRLEGQACASFSSGKSLMRNLSDRVQNTQQSGFEQTQWCDFDDKIIQIAFDEVLRYKRAASKGVGPMSEEWSDLNVDATGDVISWFPIELIFSFPSFFSLLSQIIKFRLQIFENSN